MSHSPQTIQRAVAHLSQDPQMKILIDKHIAPTWTQSNDLFFNLVESIISQQLSIKAADTILARWLKLFPEGRNPLPQEIIAQDDEKMRGAGLSYGKIKYIKNLSQAILDKKIQFEKFSDMADEEIVSELIQVKGIGRWTAEMFLIFSLHRPDVFSVGDMGLRNAVSKLYETDKNDFKKIEEIASNWSPYRSIACRYLWRSLDQKLIIEQEQNSILQLQKIENIID